MRPYRWMFWLWCNLPVLQGEQEHGWRWWWMQGLYNLALAFDGKSASALRRKSGG